MTRVCGLAAYIHPAACWPVPPSLVERQREADARRMGMTREQERRRCRERLAERMGVSVEYLERVLND